MRTILVTGGIGYIGSHTAIELLEKNYNVIILDNLSNSNIKIKDRIEELSGKKIKFYEGDVLEKFTLDRIFYNENIDTVIHFAAYKSVGDSVNMPLEYYENNVSGTINLLKVMKKNNVKNIIFSSSATVYGEAKAMPVSEKTPLMNPTNPYGKTKSMMEDILRDVYKSDNSWNIVLLRYFNPVGAHNSGLIGEMPNGIPNNLMPYISKVAAGELEFINVFGNDYDTVDGTGVRDYIHVVDLANGHVKALIAINDNCGLKVYNFGTGNGYSVLQVIKAFEKATDKKINYKIAERRSGDIGICYANPELAQKELGWKAKYDINRMCEDFWRWQCTGLKSIINDGVFI